MVSAIRGDLFRSRPFPFLTSNAPRLHRLISRHQGLDSRSSFSHSTCTRRGVRGRTTNSPRYFVEANPRYIRLVASPISYSISVSYYHTHSIYLLQIPLDDGRGREPAHRGATDATDFAGGSRKRRTRRRRKRRRPISGDERMAPAPTPPATATAATAMTPSAERCSLWRISFAGWRGGAPLVSTALDSLRPSVPLLSPC